MALPVVKSTLDCVSLDSALPYLYQLKPLPSIYLEAVTSPAALYQVYLDTNPLITSFAFSLALAPVVLVISELNKNYSQIDRLWSILPTVYNAHYALYAYLAGLETTRMGAVALASTIWSCRLTYNYWRRGGYQVGSEDYRWEVVKDYAGPTLMFLFNVVFISFAQSFLLFIVTTPTYIVLLLGRLSAVSSFPAFTTVDGIMFGTMVILIGLTAIADQQQWNFHNAKAAYRKTAKVPSGYDRDELDRGFNSSGFFAYSRKPNYAFEQAIWCTLYIWSCTATGTYYNWSGIGALSYLILFQSSTWITELLSERRYPEYKEYRRQVGKFIPTSLSAPTFRKAKGRIMNGANEKDAKVARERYDLR
jgi:steroid 5-alpha reductase family enzyme